MHCHHHHHQHSAATATATTTTPCTSAHPKSQVHREIIVELKVTSRSDNPITEYLLCNILFGCEGKEFLVFAALYKNLQNADCENT
jgi:hypothetical protein